MGEGEGGSKSKGRETRMGKGDGGTREGQAKGWNEDWTRSQRRGEKVLSAMWNFVPRWAKVLWRLWNQIVHLSAGEQVKVHLVEQLFMRDSIVVFARYVTRKVIDRLVNAGSAQLSL